MDLNADLDEDFYDVPVEDDVVSRIPGCKCQHQKRLQLLQWLMWMKLEIWIWIVVCVKLWGRTFAAVWRGRAK